MCDGSVVNAYAFPPFCLVEPLLRFIVASQAVVTVVVPKFFPVPFWWPVIHIASTSCTLVAPRHAEEALLVPSKHGFKPQSINFELWAFRVSGTRN
jgi:hypothetical protein